MTSKTLRRIGGHAFFILAFMTLWELASVKGWLDPTFFGRPSGIYTYRRDGFFVDRGLWKDLAYTLLAAAISFAVASAAAVLVGLLFAMLRRFHAACEPYLTLLNAMPRIALAPLFLLWFGLGLGSKVAVGVSLSFFIVLSSTVAGIRGVNADHLILSRALGARPSQIFRKVTLPSAVPIIFSGLRLGLVYSLLGVVAAELIAAEHGLGQVLAYLQSTFDMNGVMGLLLLLALLGLAITAVMNWIEKSCWFGSEAAPGRERDTDASAFVGSLPRFLAHRLSKDRMLQDHRREYAEECRKGAASHSVRSARRVARRKTRRPLTAVHARHDARSIGS